jgi:CrcB protein
VIPALVALGGGVGAVLRYWIGSAVQGVAAAGSFPLGTLVVNVLGCFTIGVVAELAERRGYMTSEARACVVIGILGGFTTFSAFANDTVNALRAGSAAMGFVNVTASVILCLMATWAGRSLFSLILR